MFKQSKHRDKNGKRKYAVKGDPDKLDQRRQKMLSYNNQALWNKAAKAHAGLVKKDKERGFDNIGLGYPNETISFDDYLAVVKLPCYYCTNITSGGVDRLDSNFGHWICNIVPCCETCNIILGTLPPQVKENLKDGLRKSFEDGLLNDWLPPYKRGKKIWK